MRLFMISINSSIIYTEQTFKNGLHSNRIIKYIYSAPVMYPQHALLRPAVYRIRVKSPRGFI